MDFLPKKTPGAQQRGQVAEDRALAYLQAQGLRLVERNYRTPGRGGGEIDLVMQDAQGTIIFVEVRSRAVMDFGGAGASIGVAKQRRWVLAARYWLMQHGNHACRFDAVLIDGAQLQWLTAVLDVD